LFDAALRFAGSFSRARTGLARLSKSQGRAPGCAAGFSRWRLLASGRDGSIRHLNQLGATAAHLDGDIAQGRAMKSDERATLVMRATYIRDLAERPVLEFLKSELLNCVALRGKHKIILASNCFIARVP